MGHMASTDAFAHYMAKLEGDDCYIAGLPGYPRNFSRDALLAGILAGNERLLLNQLAISCKYQGTANDPITGEEPGKIHHEYPGYPLRQPYLSTYNACDTTALYLIAIDYLGRLNMAAQQQFVLINHKSVELAVLYLQRHIHDDIFWEYPPAGAPQYSLRVTYWKDSIMPRASQQEEPAYPVTIALAHFQAARGLLAAASIMEKPELGHAAQRMYERGISTFITPTAFCIAQDSVGRLEQPSSDELHCLAYIPTDYVHHLPITAIWSRTEPLITAAGISCAPRDVSCTLTDTYHGYMVWIFEQAFLHYASSKFGLPDLAAITERCVAHIGDGQELLSVEPLIAPLGNTHQLWSVAAKEYFGTGASLRTVGGL